MTNTIINKNMCEELDINYTVTTRNIKPYYSIKEYLDTFFYNINHSKIESLFGFSSTFSPLYGGRKFVINNTLTEKHFIEMKNLNIKTSLTLTNHYFTEEAYKTTIPLLERHHKNGNIITCFNDTLAKRLKKDFPLYILNASVIKNLTTIDKIINVFELYDNVVIPIHLNNDLLFMESIPQKENIILFANAGCAYNCPLKICYLSVSNFNQNRKKTDGCSKKQIKRPKRGITFFNIKKLYEMGFKNFKIVKCIN